MEERHETIFETIDELLLDKTIKFSKLAGMGPPVWERVKNELTEFWEEEAKTAGRLPEEFAR